ncbi:MAG: hypothetical protein WBB69_16225 [Anaerolineales bacterium]
MKQKQTRAFSPLRIGIFGSVILALLHLILLGYIFQRRNATSQLIADRMALEENYSNLQDINQEQINIFQTELDTVQAEIVELEASFPELGAPFAIYRRGMDLSQKSQVNLQNISYLGRDLQELLSGPIIADSYSIRLNGSLTACITFIKNIEEAGMDTVSMESATIWPEEELCSLDLITIGLPTALE